MITLISGTNRPGSNTLKVTRALERLYADADIAVQVLDLAALPPEVFLPSSYAEKPDSFGVFSEMVLNASGLHLVTPEYNGSLPGVLKYFIDLLPFPASFDHRPVCFTGIAAGMWGALRPVEQLQAIFSYRNAYLFPTRVFIPHVQSVLDEGGGISDLELKKRLENQVAGFGKFAKICAEGT